MHNSFPPRLQDLQSKLHTHRNKILNHSIYECLHDLSDLQIFMQHHVYAVWDFMSLLKSLQARLTCTSTPWFPVGDPYTRYLINEIVLSEESDVDEQGHRASHFEMYLDAMQQIGANIHEIQTFIGALQSGNNWDNAFQQADTPISCQHFLRETFSVIQKGKTHEIAATFAFGREDLIPDLFVGLVNDLHRFLPNQVSKFKYYLDRHVQLDGDEHGQMTLEMMCRLCGDDMTKWEEAEAAAIKALMMRKLLWDGVVAELKIG